MPKLCQICRVRDHQWEYYSFVCFTFLLLLLLSSCFFSNFGWIIKWDANASDANANKLKWWHKTKSLVKVDNFDQFDSFFSSSFVLSLYYSHGITVVSLVPKEPIKWVFSRSRHNQMIYYTWNGLKLPLSCKYLID